MKVVDIRNVFEKRRIQLFYVDDDFIYYAEEKLQGELVISIYSNIIVILAEKGWLQTIPLRIHLLYSIFLHLKKQYFLCLKTVQAVYG